MYAIFYDAASSHFPHPKGFVHSATNDIFFRIIKVLQGLQIGQPLWVAENTKYISALQVQALFGLSTIWVKHYLGQALFGLFPMPHIYLRCLRSPYPILCLSLFVFLHPIVQQKTWSMGRFDITQPRSYERCGRRRLRRFRSILTLLASPCVAFSFPVNPIGVHL